VQINKRGSGWTCDESTELVLLVCIANETDPLGKRMDDHESGKKLHLMRSHVTEDDR
jgi:hypothetical protein